MSELDAWKRLADEVAAGNLTLKVDREGLDAAVKHLQDYIDSVKNLRQPLQVVETVTGFGGFQIGVQLAQKFTDKGSGDESIKQRANELVDEAKAIQDTLRKAAAAYVETDHQSADAITRGTQP